MTKKARLIIKLLKAGMQGDISYSGSRTNGALREYRELIKRGIRTEQEMNEEEDKHPSVASG